MTDLTSLRQVIPPSPEDSFEVESESELENNEFSCSICKELLCEPLTLLCQHSYCFECISTYYNAKNDLPNMMTWQNDRWEQRNSRQSPSKDKCPLCKFPFTLPPKYNHEFEEVLKLQFPEEYSTRQRDVELKRKKDKEHETMRKEVWNMIVENPPSKYDNYNGFRDCYQTTCPINIREATPDFTNTDSNTYSNTFSIERLSLVFLGGFSAFYLVKNVYEHFVHK